MRCFGGDGTLRENPAGDVLASLTTKVWNAAPKSWTGAAAMADALLNRGMTVQFADAVAFAQIGIVALDGPIELEALRLYGLRQVAPAGVQHPGGRRGQQARLPELPSQRALRAAARCAGRPA